MPLINNRAFVASGAGIDLSSLIVVEGKLCWDLYIEGLVVSSDGNLLDALGAAIKVHFLEFCLLFYVSFVYLNNQVLYLLFILGCMTI